MKTNKLWSIMMMLVLVLGTMVAFSSCSNDDDDDNASGGSLLIGRWYFDKQEDDSGIEFYKDGTTYNHNWWGTGKGSYVYNKNNATLTIKSPNRTETYFNVAVTNTSLSFIDNEAYTYYLTK